MKVAGQIGRSGKPLPRIAWLVVPVVVIVLILSGCSGNGIGVNTADKSRFGPADDWETVTEGSDRERTERRPHAPFFTLSTYDWDYTAWLQDFTDLAYELQLPASADVYVSVTLYPTPSGREPQVHVTCETPAEECRRLVAQLDSLGEYPPLPTDFPHAELEVIISRLPR